MQGDPMNKVIYGLRIFVVIGFLTALATAAQAASLYRCTQDTYLDAASPDDNFGGSDRLLIANNKEPGRALLIFAIPAAAEASNIKSAEIILYSAPWTGGGGGEMRFEVYALTHSWTEGTCERSNDPVPDDGATWNQYLFSEDNSTNTWEAPGGDYDSSMKSSGTFPAGNDWGPCSIDVTALVQSRLESLKSNGFLIKHPDEDGAGGWQNFAGKDSSGYDPPRHPHLKIEYFDPPPNNAPAVPSAPTPADNATDITADITLSWQSSDPDPDDTVTFDVYFGPQGTMTLVSSDQTAAAYRPAALNMATTYEWQIVAKDNNGAETAGPVWSFSTAESALISIDPTSGSPVYFNDSAFIPRLQPVRITGSGTNFRFRATGVSFDDEGIKTVFAFPLSQTEILALIVITESAQPGLHSVTVTTGDETAQGVDLFEVKKYWRGEDTITVQQGTDSAAVALRGLPVYLFNEKETVRLSDIVEKSAITDTPGIYFYNLIANDGYSLERGILLAGWGTGLPSWQDMQKGYLYQTESFGLMAGWEEDTVGGQIGQAYNVKWMENGIIELRQEDIL